jgi:uncharacterized membrane protein
MTYNTKAEFMAALKSQAEKYSLSFGEMAEDFERHFSEGEENGETESEICAKLGDPVEIVKDYAGEEAESTFDKGNTAERILRFPGSKETSVSKYLMLDAFVVDLLFILVAIFTLAYIIITAAFMLTGIIGIASAFLSSAPESAATLLFGREFNVFAGLAIIGISGFMTVLIPTAVKICIKIFKKAVKISKNEFADRGEEF